MAPLIPAVTFTPTPHLRFKCLLPATKHRCICHCCRCSMQRDMKVHMKAMSGCAVTVANDNG
jgi:hypothetical protein